MSGEERVSAHGGWAFVPRLTVLALVLLPALAEAMGISVARIEVTGNRRTRTEVILRALGVEAGEEVSPEALPDLKRRVLNLRLFSDAKVGLRPSERGAVLEVVVTERWTLLPIPFFSSSAGRWQAGLFAIETNLFGLAKTAVAGGVVSNRGGSAFGLYRDPAVRGTRWTGGVSLAWSETNRERIPRDEVVDAYTDGRLEASAAVGYRFTDALEMSVGGFGFANRPRSREGFAPAPGRGEVYGVQLEAAYDGQDYRAYFDEGLSVRLRVSEGLTALGSSRPFRRVFAAAAYTQALPRAHTITVRAIGDVREGDPFLDALPLGGVAGSRGFQPGGLWAEEALSASLEYQIPFWQPRWGTLAAIGFADAGVARWRGERTDWIAPGLGLRLYLRNVAIPALGIDLTRSPATGELLASLAVGFAL